MNYFIIFASYLPVRTSKKYLLRMSPIMNRKPRVIRANFQDKSASITTDRKLINMPLNIIGRKTAIELAMF